MHKFVRIEVSPLVECCFIVYCPETHEAAVIDAGDEAPRIAAEVQRLGLTPKILINTHCHVDHVSAVAALQELWDLPFYAHANEDMLLKMLIPSQSFYGFGDGKVPRRDQDLVEGMRVKVGSFEIEVIETPGHTPGGVCLKVENDLFTGDSLFAGSIGRTDLPGGDYQQLMRSLKDKLMPLDEGLRVHPGHGPSSFIGAEKASNPFLAGI
ncbi:MAG: MBL fold metallo-hydrolase [bacterium]|nr:MBL fold metallo-hydrolase [bacterium]